MTRVGFNTINALHPLVCTPGTYFVASGVDTTPSYSAPLSPARGLLQLVKSLGAMFQAFSLPLDARDVAAPQPLSDLSSPSNSLFSLVK